jgi:hypothetical protein
MNRKSEFDYKSIYETIAACIFVSSSLASPQICEKPRALS